MERVVYLKLSGHRLVAFRLPSGKSGVDVALWLGEGREMSPIVGPGQLLTAVWLVLAILAPSHSVRNATLENPMVCKKKHVCDSPAGWFAFTQQLKDTITTVGNINQSARLAQW